MGGVSARFLSWAARGSASVKQHPATSRYPDIFNFTFVLPFLYIAKARSRLEGHLDRMSVENDGARTLAELNFDAPPQRRQNARAVGQGKLQHAPGILPRYLHTHPLAFTVVEGAAVVFVQQKRSISAGINRNGKGLIHFLLDVL